jgi:hypothetical protein
MELLKISDAVVAIRRQERVVAHRIVTVGVGAEDRLRMNVAARERPTKGVGVGRAHRASPHVPTTSSLSTESVVTGTKRSTTDTTKAIALLTSIHVLTKG